VFNERIDQALRRPASRNLWERAMAEARSKDDAAIEELRADLQRLREDISALSGHLRGAADESVDDVRQRLRDASARANQAARENWYRGRSTVESEISERPLTVIGVAFAAGVLIGRLLGR
jgi:ElaB/YqjD/DUF883 family membrane-anchored ribosome-binding protein